MSTLMIFRTENFENTLGQCHGAKSFRISYHTPEGLSQSISSNDSVNTYTITGLESDFIYDIRVELFNNLDATEV